MTKFIALIIIPALLLTMGIMLYKLLTEDQEEDP